MAETTSLRLSDDTKEQIKAVLEKGGYKNIDDMLNAVLRQQQADMTKDSAPMLTPAIEAVETLTSRIIDVLTGAGRTIEANEDKQKGEIERLRASSQERIAGLEQQLTESKTEIVSLAASKEVAAREIERLTAELVTAKALIATLQEQQAANAALTTLIAELTAKNEKK